MASTSRMCVRNLLPNLHPATRPFDEARDVHELDRRRDDDLRLGDLLQLIHPRVRHVTMPTLGSMVQRIIHAASALQIAGDGVKQGGLAHVGQTDDSSS